MAEKPNLENMLHNERMSALVSKLGDPVAVEIAADLLKLKEREWNDAMAGYKMAAARHGTLVPAPEPFRRR